MCFVALSTLYKCGKCPECLSDLRREWSIRLQLHSLHSGHKAFIAHLTYDNEHVPKTKSGLLTLKKKDVQDFLKRLRYYEKDKKISYYISGEYGSPSKTCRPHYHCIFFGFDESLSEDEVIKVLQKAWKNGYVRYTSMWVQSYAQLHYCTKYVINFYDDKFSDKVKPFRLASNNFGIDFINYAKTNNLYHSEIQDKFICTTKIVCRKTTKCDKGYIEELVPVEWLKEKPYVYDFNNHKKVLNPILKEFPDFIEIYDKPQYGKKAKTYRYPLPRYFAERLYTRSFRLALAIKNEFYQREKVDIYKSMYNDYDSSSSVPMWLQIKRNKWDKKKKNYKDKNYYKSIQNKLL